MNARGNLTVACSAPFGSRPSDSLIGDRQREANHTLRSPLIIPPHYRSCAVRVIVQLRDESPSSRF